MTAGLRRASAADAPGLAALINAAYEVERFFVRGDRTSPEDVAALMDKGAFLVAEEEGRPVGCVYVEARGERGYFGLLSVEPARHGRGLGRRLVAAAEERLGREGCRAVDILVVNLREELPPFYRRLGYAESGTLPFQDPRLIRPCHFISMSKPLPPGPSAP